MFSSYYFFNNYIFINELFSLSLLGDMKEGGETERRHSAAPSEGNKQDDGTILSQRTSEPAGGAKDHPGTTSEGPGGTSVDGQKSDRSTSGVKSEDARETDSKAPTKLDDTIKEDDGK